VAKPKNLTMGVDSPSPSPNEEKERIEVLRATVAKYLPEFVKGVNQVAQHNVNGEATMILHQDAFAASYHDDEYTLLGMAIKYAGLQGVEITIIGKNHDTF
jgi:hypothetical protein